MVSFGPVLNWNVEERKYKIIIHVCFFFCFFFAFAAKPSRLVSFIKLQFEAMGYAQLSKSDYPTSVTTEKVYFKQLTTNVWLRTIL